MPRMKPWAFALVYGAVSLLTEIVLLVVFRLKVPHNNGILGPIVLTVPPVLTAWIAGCRGLRPVAVTALVTAALTLAATVVVTRVTGKSVGLLEPLIDRPLAGLVAELVVRAHLGTRASVETG